MKPTLADRAPRGADEVERWCADFATRCRKRGLRLTPQRLAVYRVLAADPSHPTVETVHARVRPLLPTLSQATTYRILESLERERLVRRVSTTGGVARFDANLEPHQHIVCRVCGRMVDHFAPELAARLAPDAVPGFVVEELDVRVVGRCVGCRDAGALDESRSTGSSAAGARRPARSNRSPKPRSSRRRT